MEEILLALTPIDGLFLFIVGVGVAAICARTVVRLDRHAADTGGGCFTTVLSLFFGTLALVAAIAAFAGWLIASPILGQLGMKK